MGFNIHNDLVTKAREIVRNNQQDDLKDNDKDNDKSIDKLRDEIGKQALKDVSELLPKAKKTSVKNISLTVTTNLDPPTVKACLEKAERGEQLTSEELDILAGDGSAAIKYIKIQKENYYNSLEYSNFNIEALNNPNTWTPDSDNFYYSNVWDPATVLGKKAFNSIIDEGLAAEYARFSNPYRMDSTLESKALRSIFSDSKQLKEFLSIYPLSFENWGSSQELTLKMQQTIAKIENPEDVAKLNFYLWDAQTEHGYKALAKISNDVMASVNYIKDMADKIEYLNIMNTKNGFANEQHDFYKNYVESYIIPELLKNMITVNETVPGKMYVGINSETSQETKFQALVAAQAHIQKFIQSGALETYSKVWHTPRGSLPDYLFPLKEAELNWHSAMSSQYTASNKVQIMELTTAKQLNNESDALKHCVGYGGYASKCCATGETTGCFHILSLRDKNGKPTSTVEIELVPKDQGLFSVAKTDFDIKVIQHQAIQNTPPSSADAEALSEYLKKLESGQEVLSVSDSDQIENNLGRNKENTIITEIIYDRKKISMSHKLEEYVDNDMHALPTAARQAAVFNEINKRWVVPVEGSKPQRLVLHQQAGDWLAYDQQAKQWSVADMRGENPVVLTDSELMERIAKEAGAQTGEVTPPGKNNVNKTSPYVGTPAHTQIQADGSIKQTPAQRYFYVSANPTVGDGVPAGKWQVEQPDPLNPGRARLGDVVVQDVFARFITQSRFIETMRVKSILDVESVSHRTKDAQGYYGTELGVPAKKIVDASGQQTFVDALVQKTTSQEVPVLNKDGSPRLQGDKAVTKTLTTKVFDEKGLPVMEVKKVSAVDVDAYFTFPEADIKPAVYALVADDPNGKGKLGDRVTQTAEQMAKQTYHVVNNGGTAAVHAAILEVRQKNIKAQTLVTSLSKLPIQPVDYKPDPDVMVRELKTAQKLISRESSVETNVVPLKHYPRSANVFLADLAHSEGQAALTTDRLKAILSATQEASLSSLASFELTPSQLIDASTKLVFLSEDKHQKGPLKGMYKPQTNISTAAPYVRLSFSDGSTKEVSLNSIKGSFTVPHAKVSQDNITTTVETTTTQTNAPQPSNMLTAQGAHTLHTAALARALTGQGLNDKGVVYTIGGNTFLPTDSAAQQAILRKALVARGVPASEAKPVFEIDGKFFVVVKTTVVNKLAEAQIASERQAVAVVLRPLIDQAAAGLDAIAANEKRWADPAATAQELAQARASQPLPQLPVVIAPAVSQQLTPVNTQPIFQGITTVREYALTSGSVAQWGKPSGARPLAETAYERPLTSAERAAGITNAYDAKDGSVVATNAPSKIQQAQSRAVHGTLIINAVDHLAGWMHFSGKAMVEANPKKKAEFEAIAKTNRDAAIELGALAGGPTLIKKLSEQLIKKLLSPLGTLAQTASASAEMLHAVNDWRNLKTNEERAAQFNTMFGTLISAGVEITVGNVSKQPFAGMAARDGLAWVFNAMGTNPPVAYDMVTSLLLKFKDAKTAMQTMAKDPAGRDAVINAAMNALAEFMGEPSKMIGN